MSYDEQVACTDGSSAVSRLAPSPRRLEPCPVVDADGEMQGVASAQAQRVLSAKRAAVRNCKPDINRMVKLSTLSRVNIASASARWMASICPLRSFMERAAENSVITQSLIARSLGSCSPSLHAAGLRLISQGCNEQRRIQIKRQ
jgi:hypothetical protein